MPEKLSIPTEFSIDFVGELEKVSDMISKARARIYYKYGNRNGTWITDEFAEKLNATLSHVPIVGTYDPETEDFVDHQDNGQKRAYGFVPNEANMSWEKDEESGKMYMAADVYLWTGYWPEASKIINKQQSMELLRESISGDWKVVGGDFYFVYQTGAFKGLCALGDAVTPCFEKSAFYSLDEESRSFFASLNEINRENQEGGQTMPNPEEVKVNEEFQATEETSVVETTVEETTPVGEFVEETSEETAPEDFEKMTSTTQVIVIETVEEEESGYKSTTVEQSERVRVVEYAEYEAKEAEVATLTAQVAEYQARIAELETEIKTLGEYRAAFIKNEKLAIVDLFKRKLSDEEISSFVESLDNYTTDELRTKLSVVVAEKVLAEAEIPVQAKTEFVSVHHNESVSGTVAILRQHTKR